MKTRILLVVGLVAIGTLLAGCQSGGDAPLTAEERAATKKIIDEALANVLASSSPQASPANKALTCDQAVSRAASVPMDQSANAELSVATDACATVAEFTEAAQKYPNALGLTSVFKSDVAQFLPILCFKNSGTKLCLSAKSQGLLDG